MDFGAVRRRKHAHCLPPPVGGSRLAEDVLFHGDLDPKALRVPPDGDHREGLATAAKVHRAVTLGYAPLDVDSVPSLRVTYVRDRYIVVRGPEAWDERALSAAYSSSNRRRRRTRRGTAQSR